VVLEFSKTSFRSLSSSWVHCRFSVILFCLKSKSIISGRDLDIIKYDWVVVRSTRSSHENADASFWYDPHIYNEKASINIGNGEYFQ
jgi:hypothetical protein